LPAGFRVRASVLYGRYQDWCKRTGEEPCSMRRFGELFDDIEGVEKKKSDGIWYTGIMLRPEKDT
jgi:putative DNA primase/helicase